MVGAIADAATRLSRAFGRSYANAQGMDVPGPAIRVSPFRPGEVTGEGIAVKALTALMAGRRAAANTRLVNEARALRAAHEAALIQQLEAHANPPRKTYTTPSGEAMNLTEPEYLAHYGVFHPKAATTGRVHIPAEDATKLGVPFDTASGTAATPDVNYALRKQATETTEQWRERVAKMVESRFERAQGATQTRFDTSQKGVADRSAAQREQASWNSLMSGLDKNEQSVEQDALSRHLGYGANMLRVLQDPSQSVTLRQKAARALNVQPLRNPKDNSLITDPNTGAQMYDMTGAEQKVKDFATRNAARARANAASLHAADRLYYTQRLHEATGRAAPLPAAAPAAAPAGAPAAAPTSPGTINFDTNEIEYLRALGVPLPGTESIGPALDEQPEAQPEEAPEDTSYYDKPVQ